MLRSVKILTRKMLKFLKKELIQLLLEDQMLVKVVF